tara:strand:+ start:7236 stop:8405 length:1170 start_codon:yes stop_codon:yes gene_type:complete
MIRKTIFWTHLISAVAVGFVVLVLSITGLVLTYERQITDLADQHHYFRAPASADQPRLSIDSILNNIQTTDFRPTTIVLSESLNAPIVLSQGRNNSVYVNPYTSEEIPPGNLGLHEFFSVVTRIHRWFNLSGDSRELGKAVTGASNLLFLFIIVSGLYLWLPKVFSLMGFRSRVWFSGAKTLPARDFNWHHVYGIWAAIPLIIIVTTGTVFGYSWSNNLVYQLVGEEAPQRGRRPGQSGGASNAEEPRSGLPIETLTQHAIDVFEARHPGGWNTVSVTLGKFDATEMEFSFDQGNGGEPQKRHVLSINTANGELASYSPFTSQSKGRQLRSWIRYLHTGEALGLIGQTIAGFACLAAVLMIWTGISMSLRRLRRYLNKQRGFAVRLAGE